MNPLFASTASADSVSTALRCWPELAGKKVRPLLVTAFGEVFVETPTGEVLSADPIELSCQPVASSVDELEALFANPGWAQERLLTEVALLAEERGKQRESHQVFAIAPHPLLGGKIRVENLVPMDLEIWHDICAQIREKAGRRPYA